MAVAGTTEEGVWKVNGSSKRVVLVCEECGERTVLDGPLSVWRSGRTSLGCECGKQFTPAERLERERLGEAGRANAAARTSSPPYR